MIMCDKGNANENNENKKWCPRGGLGSEQMMMTVAMIMATIMETLAPNDGIYDHRNVQK